MQYFPSSVFSNRPLVFPFPKINAAPTNINLYEKAATNEPCLVSEGIRSLLISEMLSQCLYYIASKHHATSFIIEVKRNSLYRLFTMSLCRLLGTSKGCLQLQCLYETGLSDSFARKI